MTGADFLGKKCLGVSSLEGEAIESVRVVSMLVFRKGKGGNLQSVGTAWLWNANIGM